MRADSSPAIPKCAALAHWTPRTPSLMAHVQQRAEDAGVPPLHPSVRNVVYRTPCGCVVLFSS